MHKDAYMICAISKKKDSKDEEISIEKLVKKADCDNEYLEEFVDALKESGTCRFGVVDWNNKLVFVSWVPDTGKAQDKIKFLDAHGRPARGHPPHDDPLQ